LASKGFFLIAVGALSIAGGAIASASFGSVVWLHYAVRENDPEKLQKMVTVPVERVLPKLERVAQINSTTSHGTVDVEIGFQGGATEQDLAAVTAQLERLEFDDDVVVVSRTLGLRSPRLSFEAVHAQP
jgi:hypothetical protein